MWKNTTHIEPTLLLKSGFVNRPNDFNQESYRVRKSQITPQKIKSNNINRLNSHSNLPTAYQTRHEKQNTFETKKPSSSPAYSASYQDDGLMNRSYYAGAKFCDPPHPSSLPKPPCHWKIVSKLYLDNRRTDLINRQNKE